MTDKLRELLEDVQTVYEGKGMVVHPSSFDKLRMEVIKLDNINRLQCEQIEKMKNCGNCKNYSPTYGLCCYSLGDEDYDCRLRKWEIKEK